MNNETNKPETHPKDDEEREQGKEGTESSEHKIAGAPADDGTPFGSTDQHSDA